MLSYIRIEQEKTLNKFWQDWKREYLMELGERCRRDNNKVKWKMPVIAPQEGEVVLIKSDEPRGCWRMGRIVHFFPSKDGLVRVAKVQIISKQGKSTIVRRSVRQLYPLEIRENVSRECRDVSREEESAKI
ncbi:MAG: hypothetical protein GY816_20040 [Cytophagales bacterium]|nr:hypothetical protein [Cytophagales bacterium]